MIKINPVWLIGSLLVCLLGYGAIDWWSNRAVSHGPGVIAPDAPLQQALEGNGPIDYKGYVIQPLARFQLQARVLGRENYHFDAGAGRSGAGLGTDVG